MIAMRTIIRNEDVNNWCNVIRHIQKLKVGLLVYVTIKLAGHPQLRMGNNQVVSIVTVFESSLIPDKTVLS